MTSDTQGLRAAGPAASKPGNDAGRFRLLRYFTVTTLVAFAGVGMALYTLQRMEERFFDQVQREQTAFFVQAQTQLGMQHEAAARDSLLTVHESNHVNLTRLVANMLWDTDFAPFVAGAQRLSIDHCRSKASAGPSTAESPVRARRDCFAEVGRGIQSLPGFAALDVKAYTAMRNSTVFKIKIFDLRGVTVYSSEHVQIGEDGFGNQGWKSAAAGRPASELTHRDRFSAFERVVENRDLISTYVPVRAGGQGEVVGVFEIYSDVTPFLGQIKAASARFAQIATADQTQVELAARSNQDKVNASSNRFLVIVGGLLVLLYAASLLIVRNGQRIIDTQMLAQEQSRLRESLWHREKMAALATMAASVSHEVGNPLAVISGLAEDLSARGADDEVMVRSSKLILDQTARIATMMRRIGDFASAPNLAPEWVDINAIVKAVCDFMSFDRRFRDIPIEFRPGTGLPARQLVPDYLNEVLLGLLQAWVQTTPGPQARGRIQVGTEARDDDVVIRMAFEPAASGTPGRAAPDSPATRLGLVQQRVSEMGARLTYSPGTVEIALPARQPEPDLEAPKRPG